MTLIAVWLLAGAAAGAVAAWTWLQRPLAAERSQGALLRAQLAEAGAACVQLAELRAQLSGLRHDLRGILSPALLVSDRLLTHEEPHVRRAGEVMVRTVERASARLMDTRLYQMPATNPQQ